MPAHSVNYITNYPIARFKQKKATRIHAPSAGGGGIGVQITGCMHVCVLETGLVFLFMSDISTVSVSAVNDGWGRRWVFL